MKINDFKYWLKGHLSHIEVCQSDIELILAKLSEVDYPLEYAPNPIGNEDGCKPKTLEDHLHDWERKFVEESLGNRELKTSPPIPQPWYNPPPYNPDFGKVWCKDSTGKPL